MASFSTSSSDTPTIYPITSYGIILYRLDGKRIEFLVGSRRDSIAYIEFIRGSLSRDEIPRYITMMTNDEKIRILTQSFRQLWMDLWLDSSSFFFKGYQETKVRFEENVLLFNRELNVRGRVHTTEWGFPKGRRKPGETEIDTASREFEEETNISRFNIIVNPKYRFIEQYTGLDGNQYQNIFYMATCKHDVYLRQYQTPYFLRRRYVSPEIEELRWEPLARAQSIVSVKKGEMMTKIASIVSRSESCPFF